MQGNRVLKQGNGWHRKLRVYGFVLAAAVFMVTVVFVAKKIYPFGDRSLVYADGDQYFGILGYLQSTFYTDNNLLYSWSNVLGGNMIGTLAYYCASPFNLLLVFFPERLMLGYHFIFGVKLLAAALCFAVMLENIFSGADIKAIVLFSVSYPFIGYMAYYAWNQSWMDGVIFLPLVLLGIWKIIKQSQPLLYIASLAFVLFSNYYIGYMICIASVLLFLCGIVLLHPVFDRKMARILICYAVSSITAAALVAVLLLPAFFVLPEGRSKTITEILQGMGYLCKPVDVLSMLYTYPFRNMDDSNNFPAIYSGIVQFVLVLLFFFNKNISKRYKAVSGVLLLVFMLSFANSALNIAWHGFAVNAWFNYRYSFIVSFVLELLAFYSFTHTEGTEEKLLLSGICAVGITAMVMSSAKENAGALTVFFDVILICTTFVLLHMYINRLDHGKKKGRLLCFVLIAAVTWGNLMENTILSLDRLADMGGYRNAMDVRQETAAIINDDGFYRTGSVWAYTRCYAMLAGFAGVQNYASSENVEALEACAKLGIEHNWMWCQYDDNVPLSTDALLGLKYIVVGTGYKSEFYTVKGQIPDKGLFVLENKNALPVIFPAVRRFGSEACDNKFEYMNLCWSSISGKGGDIFRRVDYIREEVPTDQGRDIYIRFRADNSDPIYIILPEGNISVEAPVYRYSVYRDVFYAGRYSPGEEGEIIIHADGFYDDSGIVVYSECQEALAAKASDAQENGILLEKKSSSHLLFEYHAERDGFLTSTIPFDQAWHVYIDGNETPVYRNMDSFLAFDCPEGTHRIELRYWPLHFRMGATISVMTLLGIVLAICLKKKWPEIAPKLRRDGKPWIERPEKPV